MAGMFMSSYAHVRVCLVYRFAHVAFVDWFNTSRILMAVATGTCLLAFLVVMGYVCCKQCCQRSMRTVQFIIAILVMACESIEGNNI